MNRKKRVLWNKILTLVLVIAMLCNQTVLLNASDAATASEVMPGDEGSNAFTDGSTEPDAVSADTAEPGDLFSDGSDRVSQEQALAVEAHLRVEELSENNYVLGASWEIQGADGSFAYLAMEMDPYSYESLPDPVKAGEDGVCQLPLMDGGYVAMEKTIMDSGDIRLVCEQTAGTTIAIRTKLTGQNLPENMEKGYLSVKWCEPGNENWMEAARTEVNWITSEADAANPVVDDAQSGEEEPAGTGTTEAETEENKESAENAENVESADNGNESAESESAEPVESDIAENTESVENTENIGNADNGSESDTVEGTDTETTDDGSESNTVEGTETENPDDGSESNETESIDLLESETETITSDVFYDPPNPAAENGSVAATLDEYITEVNFRQKGQDGILRPVPVENGVYQFSAGEQNLEFEIKYTIPQGIVTKDKNIVTYQLPAAFDYADQSGIIKWNDIDAGTYTIQNEMIKLTFDPNSTFFDTDEPFDGFIKFTSGATADESGGQKHYEFNDKIKIDYEIKEEESGGQTSTDSSFNVSKTGDLTLEQNKINYSMNITPGSYGATNVTFTDKLEITGENVDVSKLTYDTIVVKDQSGSELTKLNDLSSYTPETNTSAEDGTTTITYKDNSGAVVCKETVKDGKTIITPSPGYYLLNKNADGTYRFSLPDMEPTGQYTVTYGLDLNRLGVDKDWVKNLNVKNTVNDSNNNYKDDDTTTIYNRWISKKNTGVTQNADGNFELGWEIILNPDHKDMKLTDSFRDQMEIPSGVTANNGQVTVTVKDSAGKVVKTVQVPFETINGTNPGTGNTVGEILNALELSAEGDSVKYSIQMEYTTTVDASTLPNGTSTIKNTGTVDRDGKGNSDSGEGKIQNDLLKKTFDSNVGTSFETLTFYNNYGTPPATKTDMVVALPWNCMIKIPEDADVNTEFIDTFGNGGEDKTVWVTPQKLQNSLKVMCENVKLTEGTDYELCYQYGDHRYSYAELKNMLNADGLTDEQISVCQISGFSIRLTSEGLEKLKGKTANLSYTLYGNYSDLGSDKTRTYYNTAHYGKHESKAEHSITTSYFGKWGGLNNSYQNGDISQNIASLKDGKFTWRIELKATGNEIGKDLTITDYLPAGLDLTYVGLLPGLGVDGNRQQLVASEDGTKIADGPYKASFIYMENNQIIQTLNLTVIISTDAENRRVISVTIPGEIVKKDGWFFMYVDAKLPEDSPLWDSADFEHTSQAFRNEASISVDNAVKDVTDHTITVTTDKKHVKKSGEYLEKDSKVRYTLEINPTGADLLPNANYLTLTDVLQYDPALDTYENAVDLIAGSVKAYYYDKADTEKKNKIYLPANGYDFSYKYEEVNGQDNRTNKLVAQVPDGLTLYMEYEYNLYANQSYADGRKWVIANYAKLEGVENSESHENMDLQYQQSSAGVSKNTITFYKVDEDNYSMKLYGAKFKLYYWQPYNNEWTEETAKNDSSVLIDSEHSNGCWRVYEGDGDKKEFISDIEGKFTISKLQSGIVYRLKEIESPVGYLPNNVDYYFYIYQGQNAGSLTGPDNTDNHLHIEALTGGNIVYIPNKDDEKIHATKIWGDGVEPKDIEFTLYQSTGAGYTYADTKAEPPRLTKVTADSITNPVTIHAQADGAGLSVQWNGLPKTDTNGNKIYYYVFETKYGGIEPQITSDGNVRFGETMPNYDNNNGIESGNIIITNQKIPKKVIKAKKIWGKAAVPADIELTLYRSLRNDCTYANLTAAGEGLQPELQVMEFPAGSEQTAGKTIAAGSTGNAAEVSWTDLPAYDEDGNAWYYYVFETKAGENTSPVITAQGAYKLGNYDVSYDGNGVTDGTITVTNDATELTVEKKWGEDSEQVPVTMTLYSSTEKLEPQGGAGKADTEKAITLAVHSDRTPEIDQTSQQDKWKNYNDINYFVLNPMTVLSGNTISVSMQCNKAWDGTYPSVAKIVCNDPKVQIYPATIENDNNKTVIKFLATDIENDCTFYVNVDGETVSFFDASWPYSIAKAELPVFDQPSNLLLPADAAEVSSITLGATANVEGVSTTAASYTWKNLPKTDADGNTLYYYVKETAVNGTAVDETEVAAGYKGFYTYNVYKYGPEGHIPAEDGQGYQNVTVTNKPGETPEFTDLTVVKKWQTSSGETITNPQADWSAKLQLYKQNEDKTWSTYGDQFTLPDNGSWEKKWTQLPWGNYYVKELEINGIPVDEAGSNTAGFVAAYQKEGSQEKLENAEAAAASRGTITVVNTEQPTSISVQKQWDDGNYSLRPDHIDVELYRSTEEPLPVGETEGTIHIQVNGLESASTLTDADTITVTLTETNNLVEQRSVVLKKNEWSSDIQVPMCLVNPDGTRINYTYRVNVTKSGTQIETLFPETIEQVCAGQTIVINAAEKTDRKTLTIKTTLSLDEYSELTNKGAVGTVTSDSARIGIPYNSGESGFADKFKTSVPLTCSDSNVCITFDQESSGLKNGFYYYYFIVSGITSDCEIVINNNEYPKEIVSLYTIEDAVLPAMMLSSDVVDAKNSEPVVNSGIHLSDKGILIEKGTLTESTYTKASDPVSDLSGRITGAWKYEWNNLPKTDADGNKYYYYVKETVPDGYRASYTYDENGNVTITNTNEKTGVSVIKDWSGDKVTAKHDDYSVTVQLYDSTGTSIREPQVLNRQNNWTYTWTDLPKNTTYYVRETEVHISESQENILDGFTVTYSNNDVPVNNGTITISNSREKQGIILPGTGSKYPLVFYGLGFAFLLVSTAWMLLTLKKKKTIIDAGKGGKRSKTK